MNLQVLIATMNQTDTSLLEKMNIQSDVVIVNQCDRENKEVFKWKGYTVIWIDSIERGLSRSRNMALKNATADICLLCDDDEVLKESYRNNILRAYKEIPNADAIVFNIERIHSNRSEKLFSRIEKIPFYKTYGSVHLSFKRERIIGEGICFNVNFGTGSGMYSSGEDAIFCMNIHKKKLKAFVYPAIIAEVSYQQSSWFSGYNEKYFYDVGAYLAEVYPVMKHLMKWYYPYCFRNLAALTAREIIKYISYGIKGYQKKLNYEEYMKIIKNYLK